MRPPTGAEVARRTPDRRAGSSPDLNSVTRAPAKGGRNSLRRNTRRTLRPGEPLHVAGMRGDYRGENLKIFG